MKQKINKVVNFYKKNTQGCILGLVTVGLWLYYLGGSVKVPAWQYLIFNCIMLYGISRSWEEKKNGNNKKTDKAKDR